MKKKPSKWLPCRQPPPDRFKGGRCIGRRNHQHGVSIRHRNLIGEEWT